MTSSTEEDEMQRFAITLALAAGCCLVAAVAASQATPPGTNGRIAFRVYFDSAHTSGAVFTIAPDGRGVRQITHPPKLTVDDQPDVSPDGRLIAFDRCPAEGACQVYTVRTDGGGLTRISEHCPPRAQVPSCADDTVPAFTPEGRSIIFSSERGSASSLVVYDLRTRRPRTLLHGTEEIGYSDAQLAPDGKHLSFVETQTSPRHRQAIFVADNSGASPRRITAWALTAGDDPDWSPDRTWLLFRSHEDQQGVQSQIYRVHPDGTSLQQLTHAASGDIITSCSFSPDGKEIVYGARGNGGNADLYVMNADGTNNRPITNTPRWESAPDWGTTNPATSSSG